MKKFTSVTLFAVLFCLSCLQWHGLPARENTAKMDVPQAYEKTVTESARDIPVAYDVDVVVVGGASGGVAAAVEVAQRGAKVFLAAARPYLGEDICGTYRLWLKAGEEPTSPLAKKIFAGSPVADSVAVAATAEGASAPRNKHLGKNGFL